MPLALDTLDSPGDGERAHTDAQAPRLLWALPPRVEREGLDRERRPRTGTCSPGAWS